MPSSTLDSLLDDVLRRVTPKAAERSRMEHLSKDFITRTQSLLDQENVEGRATLQGSIAKDTWLSGEADLDIFILLDQSVERTTWAKSLLPLVRDEFAEYRSVERYAEHPYLELLDENLRVNIVPCYIVEKGGRWISATDRTPHHTEYMNSKLTPELRSQVRLLKRFSKGIGVYGAEIKIGGFSGMLVEALSLKYGSFPRLLEEVSNWRAGTIVDLERAYDGREQEAIKKFQSPLIAIDPVDPNRNLAAALRTERLWEFVAASRRFMFEPDKRFFFPMATKRVSAVELKGMIREHGFDILGLWFKHEHLVPDVLWGQLFRMERSLGDLMKRHEFKVLRSKAWSDEESQSVLLYEVEQAVLPYAQLRQGPPVHRAEETMMFLGKHLGRKDTIAGPWLEDDRWIVSKRRSVKRVDELLEASLSGDHEKLSLPEELAKGLRQKRRIVLNQKVLSLKLGSGFSVALSEFLDGRPRWLFTPARWKKRGRNE